MTSNRHRLACLLAAAAWAGCAPLQSRSLDARLVAADRAIHRGRTAAAERELAAARRELRLPAAKRAEIERLEGELRLLQGRPTDARAAFEASRDAAAQAYGPTSAEAEGAAVDVADARAAAGDVREAEKLYRAAAVANGRRGELAARLSELALAAQARGRGAEAERLYRDAAAETEKASGKDDPLTAARLADWGLHLQRLDRFTEAEEVYRRALAVVEKAFLPGHPRRDAALNALGLFLEGRGRYGEAEALYKRALAEETSSGRRSEAGRNYASLLRRQGREAEAAAAEARQKAMP